MRLIDADAIIFDYSGLAYIPAHDGAAIAKYFADQVKVMPTITLPPNDPLTLDELREMDGEPVWVVQPKYKSSYGLVRVTWTVTMLVFNDRKFVSAEVAMFENEYKIYRRKPENTQA